MRLSVDYVADRLGVKAQSIRQYVAVGGAEGFPDPDVKLEGKTTGGRPPSMTSSTALVPTFGHGYHGCTRWRRAFVASRRDSWEPNTSR